MTVAIGTVNLNANRFNDHLERSLIAGDEY
jgi:hypothetical protein